MALIYIDDNIDPWIKEYEACDNLYREIMEQITLRDREPRTSQIFANLSANIRLRLKQFTTQVEQLKRKIDDACKQHTITIEEGERRIRQIEQLQSKSRQIRMVYEMKTNDLAVTRSSLLGPSTSSAFADGGTTSWGLNDDEISIEKPPTVSDLKTQQQEILQRQDEGLEELSKILSRQKQIAQTIHSEVDNQNEIIDDLADHMGRTDDRLIEGARQVTTITRKDNVCGYWIVIILLFISIVIVAFD